MADLGLLDSVAGAGTIIRRWVFSNQHGDVLCKTNLEDLWAGSPPFIGISRSKLLRVLRSNIADVPYRLGISPTALRDDGDSVRVSFSDGSASIYSAVVGCDGLRSAVRTLVHDRKSFRRTAAVALLDRQSEDTHAGGHEDEALIDGGQMVWRSIAPIRPGGGTDLQFLIGDRTFFGLCPIGNGCTYGFANVTQSRVQDPLAGRLERLRQRFAPYGPIVEEYLQSLTSDSDILCSSIEWTARVEWGQGRVLLIGDAAHASSPMLGQGGSLAMEDACVLAEMLSANSEWDEAIAAFVSQIGRAHV